MLTVFQSINRKYFTLASILVSIAALFVLLYISGKGGLVLSFIMAVTGIGLIIFVHEFGHFISAKLLGIKVEEFMIGLPGPKLKTWKIGETDYGFTAVLFGGYVKFSGDEIKPKEELEDLTEEEKKWQFNFQPLWKKTLVILAGGLMMIVFSILIYAVVLMRGVPAPTTTIEKVIAKTPAVKAGLKQGDQIVAVNGREMREWEEVTTVLHSHPDQPVKIKVRAGNAFRELTIKLSHQKNGQGFLGIISEVRTQRYGLVSAVYLSTVKNLRAIYFIVTILFKLFTTKEVLAEGRGPIGIVAETTKAAQGGLDYFLQFIALISLNLAIVNYLPIPPLDGGQLLLFVIEKIRGKMLSTDMKIGINLTGLLLVGFIFFYFLVADVKRYGPQILQLFLTQIKF